MKSIKCSQYHPMQGSLVIRMRFIGQYIYILMKEGSPQKTQMMEKFRAIGAEILTPQNSPWIRADIFKNQTVVKLADLEFDVRDKTDDELESILYNFYKNQYLLAKFKVEDVNE